MTSESTIQMTPSPKPSSFPIHIVAGALIGALGGAVCIVLGLANVVTGVLFGAAYGALFAMLAAERATTPGAGLMWGVGYAFLLWLIIPAGILPVASGQMPAMGMLDTARGHFQELIAYLICFGVPLGTML